jgi:hypothetical protein
MIMMTAAVALWRTDDIASMLVSALTSVTMIATVLDIVIGTYHIFTMLTA